MKFRIVFWNVLNNNNNPWRYSSDEPWPAEQPPLAVFPDCICNVLPCKIIVDRRLCDTCCLHYRGWSLMMEAARISETSVDNYFTRQYIPEDNSELQKKISYRCRLEWHHLPTKFHENLQSGSKVICGLHTRHIDRQTHRQAEWWLHKPTFIFGE
jgi:hypothetical protein